MKALLKTTFVLSLALMIICTSAICCFAESPIVTDDGESPIVTDNGSITVYISVENKTNTNLTGSKFMLTDINGSFIDEWVVGKTPHITSVPAPGEYYLSEKLPPDGYGASGTRELLNIPESDEPVVIKYVYDNNHTESTPSKITIQDATTVQMALAEFIEKTPSLTEKFDMNKNGRLDISDVTLMQRELAEFEV